MKNIITIILLNAMCLVTSCSKSFIERAPVSSATVDVLYKTDKDFQDAIIGTYAALRKTNFSIIRKKIMFQVNFSSDTLPIYLPGKKSLYKIL